MTTPPVSGAADDSVIDRRIGVLLRWGMLLSATVILLGGILFVGGHGRSILNYRVFHGVPADLKSPKAIADGAFHGHDLAIIQFGILLLIATPVARVAFSVIAFLLEKDFLYVVISGIVLCVLLWSLFWHQV